MSENFAYNIKLSGSINEAFQLDLKSFDRSTHQTIRVNCLHTTSVTSAGVSLWIKQFKALRDEGIQLEFYNCPPFLMSQIAMIPDIIIRLNEIKTLGCAYFCPECNTEVTKYYEFAELKKHGEVPAITCENCGATDVEYDDDESFLED